MMFMSYNKGVFLSPVFFFFGLIGIINFPKMGYFESVLEVMINTPIHDSESKD